MTHLSLPLDLRKGDTGHEVNEILPEAGKLEKNPTMIVVAAALIDGEGRVLLQQRAPGRAMAGLWEFPGGKVEPGELPEAALSRELEEELGIGVDPGRLVPACFASAPLGERHMLLLLYLCRAWRGEPRALDASALLWTTPAEMTDLAMPPADAPLIPMLEALMAAGEA
jgi:8-oxo-dGTP diphosphatase